MIDSIKIYKNKKNGINERIISVIVIFLGIFMLINLYSPKAEAASKINILVNGNSVTYTKNTGYPYRDKQNRVMVPFKATIKATGATTGYDSKKKVAIIVTDHNRIEIPLNSTTYYMQNRPIKNKPKAIINKGQIYIPIKDVLKLQYYTVEWDKKTSTVNAYNFNYDKKELVPYNTSSLKTLTAELLDGHVVYIDGNYYATPDYVEMMNNIQVHYFGDDLNESIYPEYASRYDSAYFNIEWVCESDIENGFFSKIRMHKDKIPRGVKNANKSDNPNFVEVYGFYENGSPNPRLIYPVDEMTDEFMELDSGMWVFNGIRMAKYDGTLYFSYENLKSKKICE